MGTRAFRVQPLFTSVGSTRYLAINSSQASKIVMGSGYIAISLFNQGSTPLVWGSSNITVNSGNYLYPSGRIEWTNVQDDFELYMISDSVGTFGLVAIQEYN